VPACGALAIAVVLFVTGCGGGEESTGSSSSAGAGSSEPPAANTAVPAKEAASKPGRSARNESKLHSAGGPERPAPKSLQDTSSSFTPKSHHDSGGGAHQFEAKGGDNSIQEAGSEASEADFDQATAALHTYLDARAAGAWRDACSVLAAAVTGSLLQLSAQAGAGRQAPGCPELIASLSAGIPPAALREAARADAGALRVDGSGGFLLFRGTEGSEFFMPMAEEGGSWKVAAIAASPLG
jgi:hypothetical protein